MVPMLGRFILFAHETFQITISAQHLKMANMGFLSVDNSPLLKLSDEFSISVLLQKIKH